VNTDEYQKATRQTAIYPDEFQGTPVVYLALGLAGEAGEVAGKVKKIIRDGPSGGGVNALADELGDVLWYVARLADELGFDLSTIAQLNVDKLKGRQERGTIGGSGDDR
jgi:NTP pyrophosphatase (non-canonical NTP hydrolase)